MKYTAYRQVETDSPLVSPYSMVQRRRRVLRLPPSVIVIPCGKRVLPPFIVVVPCRRRVLPPFVVVIPRGKRVLPLFRRGTTTS
jgi:hypothetical protein